MDAPARSATPGRPRLSVIVVNYLHWADTARLIRQLRQSPAFGDAAEVVVIDNNSPVHPAVPKLRRTPGVSLRRWRTNRGFARAVNEGCRLSRGDWFLLLNPDVSVPPNFLDDVLDRADDLAIHEPEAGIVGFRLLNDDGSRQLSTGRFPTLGGTLLGRLWPRASRKYFTPPPHRSRVDWVTGCGLLVRRECWRDLGGFDPTFFLYYEDVDLCRRAHQRGWSVWHDPAVSFTHHRPLHTRDVPPHLRLITRHALLTYASKHWPRWQAALMKRVVRGEAWLGAVEELGHVAADLMRGDAGGASGRIRRAVRLYDEERSRAPVDRHPVAQPGRVAGAVPVQRPPARAAGS